MKRYFGLTLLFLFTVMCTNSFSAQAVKITVGSGSAHPGQTINLPVTVDVPGEIAGAAFTLTYDKTKLTLNSITSTFFDTFSNQWNSLLPVPSPFPPVTVTVDSQTYTQPLVKNPVVGGMSISAARCKAGATNSTLFILSFTVGASVTPGQLTVNIIQTVLSNTNAGYSASGEAIPILIGALEDPELPLKDSYPVLPSTIVSGKVTVNSVFVDSDMDGIDDAWEMAIFGNLTTANATSDYDKDGYSDLQEYLNIKDGLFDPSGKPFDLKVKNAPWGTGYKPPSAMCDFNGDGKSDILWRNTVTGENVVWIMDGTTRTGTATLPTTTNQDWTIGGAGDFTSDGKPDIVWRNTVTGVNLVWIMNGVTRTGTASLPTTTNQDWTIGGVGDFTGDGKPDIVWRNTVTGVNLVWIMNGVTRTGTASLPTTTNQDWTIGGVGDFTGDGKPDIVWRNIVTGANVVWIMNGVTRTGTVSLPTTTNQDWAIGGVGDFTGDGKPDILWRNTVTGVNLVWIMDGTSRTGTASLPSTTNQDWKIMNH